MDIQGEREGLNKVVSVKTKERASIVGTVEESKEYFALTLTASENNRLTCSAQTHWAGWADGKPGREIRVPSLVAPHQMLDLWRSIGQPALVVNDPTGLYLWFRFGGNAILERALALEWVPDFLAPEECVRETPMGWVPARRVAAARLRRAPSKKLRMKILTRDGRRCRICGRRPDDHVDIELHVHHIRPVGRPHVGLTEEANLITLCHTCHKGLEPHFDLSLYEYVEDAKLSTFLSRQGDEFRDGVRRYRHLLAETLEAI